MAVDNNTIHIVVSSATIIGGIGYVIHSVWRGYVKFRDEIWEKLDEKLPSRQCEEYRRLAKEADELAEKAVARYKENHQ